MKTVYLAENINIARVIANITGANENHSVEGYISGDNHVVTWTGGHLINLALPEDYGFKSYERASLPMLPENFKLIPRQIRTAEGYKDDPRALKQLRIIQHLFNKADQIIVATSPSREGEVIFRVIYQYLKCSAPFYRLWLNSLTDTEIRTALKNLKPGNQYDNLYYAARAQAELDWLIGLNTSQALTITGRQGVCSLGRVRTPVLKVIAERYFENLNFQPNMQYQIKLTLEKYGVSFCALSGMYHSLEEVNKLQQMLRSHNQAQVITSKVNDKVVQPPLLYNLTALQKDAEQLGFTGDKTLFIAQMLYEKQLISYPCVDCEYIPENVFRELPNVIENLEQYPPFSDYAVSLKGKILNQRAVDNTQITFHHAIVPTVTHLPAMLSEDETTIFNLITGRMFEAISEHSIEENIFIKLDCLGIVFTVKGSSIKKIGWKKLFRPLKTEDENIILPVCDEGEYLKILQVEVFEIQTQPKPLFTDSSLLSFMYPGKDKEERNGIGTPATRAGSIELLIHKQYIRRHKKNLIPTEKGLAIYEIVKNMRISDLTLATGWEAVLNKVENGEISLETFRNEAEIYTVQATCELLNIPSNSFSKNALKKE